MFINAMHLKCPFALVLIVMYALMDDEWLSFVPHLLFLQIVSDVMSCRTVFISSLQLSLLLRNFVQNYLFSKTYF